MTNGPTATGKHCPEGWTLHQFPGPQLRDVMTSGSRTNFHLEGGKENRPKAVKLQLRPDPLAR